MVVQFLKIHIQNESTATFPPVSILIVHVAYREVKDPLKLYSGKDCVEVFCKHIKEEAKRVSNMFPERPMKHSTQEEWESLKE